MRTNFDNISFVNISKTGGEYFEEKSYVGSGHALDGWRFERMRPK